MFYYTYIMRINYGDYDHFLNKSSVIVVKYSTDTPSKKIHTASSDMKQRCEPHWVGVTGRFRSLGLGFTLQKG